MSYNIEVIYRAPVDVVREHRITDTAKAHCGELAYREEPNAGPSQSVCLTYEFHAFDSAANAASELRIRGEHVEGPSNYGD